MQLHRTFLAVAALSLALVSALAAETGTSKTRSPRATTIPAPAEIPQSVFVIPGSPKDGRNPFFPQSTVGVPVLKPREATTVDTAAFVLNGITSPPRRTAMINGRTFDVGEEGEIKLPSGSKVMIRCEEIRGDSAVILVGGQRRELRLRFGL